MPTIENPITGFSSCPIIVCPPDNIHEFSFKTNFALFEFVLNLQNEYFVRILEVVESLMPTKVLQTCVNITYAWLADILPRRKGSVTIDVIISIELTYDFLLLFD